MSLRPDLTDEQIAARIDTLHKDHIRYCVYELASRKRGLPDWTEAYRIAKEAIYICKNLELGRYED